MAQKYWESGINRRRFLRYTGYGSAVLAVGAATACGGNSTSKSTPSPTAAKSASATSVAASAATTAASASAAAVKSATVTQAALNMAIGSEPETLDGDKFRAGTDWYFGANVYETLLKRDVTGKQVPGVASSYDASPDGKAITFHLRPNAKFHNGDPVTAEDVKFSYE